MKERIEKIMELEKLSASRFADAIGVQRSNISHVLSGRNKPSLELVNKILDHFEKINADWLLLGKGNMINDEQDTPVKTKGYTFSGDQANPSDEPFPVKIVVFYSDQSFEEYQPRKSPAPI